jgi:antibiotic biosynthesis monooxygenase (ABM) superfamily enzyme
MNSIENLQKELKIMQDRNKKVELDKKWETSATRKLSILTLTYFVIVIFFFVINVPNPFLNAIVPALGFLLSTLTLPFIKTWWIKKQK